VGLAKRPAARFSPTNDTETPPPPTLRLTIDRAALAANWQALDRLSGAARRRGGGQGRRLRPRRRRAAPVLREAGCADFFVAHWSEVRWLARHVSIRPDSRCCMGR
jgi:alanine racemase